MSPGGTWEGQCRTHHRRRLWGGAQGEGTRRRAVDLGAVMEPSQQDWHLHHVCVPRAPLSAAYIQDGLWAWDLLQAGR